MQGDFEICKWAGGKETAVTVFFDDCWRESVNAALPVLRRHKIGANFAVIAGLVGKKFQERDCISGKELADLRAAGHEISSHTLTHPRLDSLSQAELRQELSESQRILGAETMAYPFDRHNYRARRIASMHYISARARRDRPNSSTPADLMRLNAFASVGSNAQEMAGWLEEAVGNWLIETHHLIGKSKGYRYATSPRELEVHFALLSKSRVWIGTMADVSKYIIERENSTLRVVDESNAGVKVALDSMLDPLTFNVPLSFRHDGKIFSIAPGRELRIGN